MSRPRKQTVDYFPHVIRHGQTIEILEQRYGLAGYAFWFKLLERLGDTVGHYLDCKNPIVWHFLQTKTRQDPDTTEEILNLLADLEAIDAELWRSEKIVWCQNFVNGIADAYRNRVMDIPAKPQITQKNPISSGISDVRNTPKKGEEKKREKRKDICAVLMPDDFHISERVQRWAEKNNHNHLDEHLEAFKLRAQAKGYKYKDWDAAFMVAIRENWGKIDLTAPERKPSPKTLCPDCQHYVEKCICHDPEAMQEWREYQERHHGKTRTN